MNLNKYFIAYKKEDFYLLQKLLLKDSNLILDKLSKKLNINGDELEIAYDFFIIALRRMMLREGKYEEDLDIYLHQLYEDIKLNISGEKSDNYKLDIVINNNPSPKDIEKRENVCRVHRVLKKIILEHFKEKHSIKNSIYEDLIPILNNSRFVDYYGNYYQEAGETITFFFLVIVNDDSIYRAYYTIKYCELEGQSAVKHDFKDARRLIVKYNNNYKVRRVAIEFNNGDIVQNRETYDKNGAKYERFIYDFFLKKYPHIVSERDGKIREMRENTIDLFI